MLDKITKGSCDARYVDEKGAKDVDYESVNVPINSLHQTYIH